MRNLQRNTSKNSAPKLPKWQTDFEWAIRRAKKKGRIKEAEHLFAGKIENCIEYHIAMKVFDSKATLPKELEDSLFAHSINPSAIQSFGITDKARFLSLLFHYVEITGPLSENFDSLLADILSLFAEERYTNAGTIAIKYAKICGPNISDKIEKAIWAIRPFEYSILTKKRMPPDIEEEKFKSLNEEQVVEYAMEIFKGRLPQNLENLLANDLYSCLNYAKKVMFGQLPELLHTSIIMRSFGKNEYDQIDRGLVYEYIKFVEESKKYAVNTLLNMDRNMTVGEALDSLGQKTTIN